VLKLRSVGQTLGKVEHRLEGKSRFTVQSMAVAELLAPGGGEQRMILRVD
jgi:hypothetical protein